MYRFSINTQADLRVNSHYGYGKSLIEIKESLRRTVVDGNPISVEHNSKRAYGQLYYGPHPIEISGGQAHYPHQYKIHMSQTESDFFHSHKVFAYSNVDEFWTASEWGKNAAINSGIPEEKTHVYHHGVFSEKYPSYLRGKRNKIRFLHIDSGSRRKRSDLVEHAFNIVYEKNKDIELTLKYSHDPHGGESWLKESTLVNRGNWIRPGTRHINETLSHEEMISLMHFHDVLVYPSEGEGFGLIPLEALCTGMPVISTYEWAPYSEYFLEGHLVSEIKHSDYDWGYPKIGRGTITSVDAIVEKMEEFIANITEYSSDYLERSSLVRSDYDWTNITPKFFKDFFERSSYPLSNKKVFA